MHGSCKYLKVLHVVRVVMAKRRLSDAEQKSLNVVKYYYPALPVVSQADARGKVTHTYTCRCGATRKQKAKSGYTNLWSHIKEQHADWEEEYQRHVESLVC